MNGPARLRYIPGLTTLALNAALCDGCRVCTLVCPHAVLAMNAATVRIRDRDACMECGACARNCPTGALTVRAGVGCAAAVLKGQLRGTEPQCCCDQKPCC